MNNKTNLDVLDESLFVDKPSVPFGQVIENKLGMSGVVTLQVLMGSVLAYWYYGAGQEFALVVMVLALTAIGVMHKEIRSVLGEVADKASKPMVGFIEHRHFMALLVGALICTVARRLSRNCSKG